LPSKTVISTFFSIDLHNPFQTTRQLRNADVKVFATIALIGPHTLTLTTLTLRLISSLSSLFLSFQVSADSVLGMDAPSAAKALNTSVGAADSHLPFTAPSRWHEFQVYLLLISISFFTFTTTTTTAPTIIREATKQQRNQLNKISAHSKCFRSFFLWSSFVELNPISNFNTDYDFIRLFYKSFYYCLK